MVVMSLPKDPSGLALHLQASEQFPSCSRLGVGHELQTLEKTFTAPDGLLTSSKRIEIALRDRPKEVVTLRLIVGAALA